MTDKGRGEPPQEVSPELNAIETRLRAEAPPQAREATVLVARIAGQGPTSTG